MNQYTLFLPKYVFDTNVFNEFLQKNRIYRLNVFGWHWKKIENLLDCKQIISLDYVYEELQKGLKNKNLYHPDTRSFLKRYKNIFWEVDILNQNVNDEAQLIILKFKHYAEYNHLKPLGEKTMTSNKNLKTDLLLMSLAKSRNIILVTQEKSAGMINFDTTNPKIPDVCRYFNIRCLDAVSFLEEAKITQNLPKKR